MGVRGEKGSAEGDRAAVLHPRTQNVLGDSHWPLDEPLAEVGAVEGKWSSLLFLLDKETILDRLAIIKDRPERGAGFSN